MGNIDGPGNFIGLLCDTKTDFDKERGEWVLSGDEAIGRGDTKAKAALDWIANRIGL